MAPAAPALVQLVGARLEVGRREYGPLQVADDPRDWRAEALEELVDACAYLAVARIPGAQNLVVPRPVFRLA